MDNLVDCDVYNAMTSRFQCDYCEKSFATRNKYIAHMSKAHHVGYTVKKVKRDCSYCTHCSIL